MVPGPGRWELPPGGGGEGWAGPARPHSILVQVTRLVLLPNTQPSLPCDFIPNLSFGQGAPVPRGGSGRCLGRTAHEEGLGCSEGRQGGLCPEQLLLA